MSKQSIKIDVDFWFQGTGLTGQNLSQHNQNKFERVATKFERKGYGKLSKMRSTVQAGLVRVCSKQSMAYAFCPVPS